ncbi:hypothetical protein J437_LFUL003949 [Ladona fulva]|uniref:Ribosome biogenesis protein NOP53 n=1 Tax=Ladona fulva TaxID=123851 RepID=A0A8K0P2C5_LADFU|nr:hypothetical protein J437_LFUL003949 [Ladona fulva]
MKGSEAWLFNRFTGTSYNPSLEEHSQLLSKAGQEELKVMKEEEHLKRVVTDMIPKVTVQEVELLKQFDLGVLSFSKQFSSRTSFSELENWMKEMSQGLDPSEEESSSEGGEDNDFVGNAIVSREKKKTLQKRRKIKEARLEAVKRKESKLERKKLSDIDRLSVVKKELKKEDDKLQLLRTKREKAKKAKAVQPKVLSKHKFEPLETDFSLGSELSGNLRNIKPEGSILKDRFRRMQERNIVEPRVKQT